MVRPKRFELLTPWFVAKYSIQLSYGRVRVIIREMTCFLKLKLGGERGIRTLDTDLSPYASLAGKCLRPLGQLSVFSNTCQLAGLVVLISFPDSNYALLQGRDVT
jgi:hypothetical protein